MSDVSIQWIEGRQFAGVDSFQHRIEIGPEGSGAKASDLMLTALGSCSAYDVVAILEKKRQKLTALEIRVSGDQLPDPPWTFTKCHVHYIVTGHGLEPKAVADAIALAEEKYCAVAATLRQAIPITHDYEIINIE